MSSAPRTESVIMSEVRPDRMISAPKHMLAKSATRGVPERACTRPSARGA
jgi:hypothetical protein